MNATPYLSLECARPTTLRERWLRLLRDLYALPAFHGELMDEILPDYQRPALALVKGGAERSTGSLHVQSLPASAPAARTRRARLRLVVVGRKASEEQAPTQGDGDDIDVPDTPPPPVPSEGDVPRSPRRDDARDKQSSPRRTEESAQRRGRDTAVRESVTPKRA